MIDKDEVIKALIRADAVIREVEWVESDGSEDCCAWCFNGKSEGHAKDCERQKVLEDIIRVLETKKDADRP